MICIRVGDDPESARLMRRAAQLSHACHQAAIPDEAAARPILAELLGSLGEGAFDRPPLFADYGEHIRVGARSAAASSSARG